MGVLDNTSVTVDAILTKKGREKLAKGEGQFRITKFALGDDEIDYNLYDVTHPNGSNFYGEAIENMNLLEAVPDQNLSLRYKLTDVVGGSGGSGGGSTGTYTISLAPTQTTLDDQRTSVSVTPTITGHNGAYSYSVTTSGDSNIGAYLNFSINATTGVLTINRTNAPKTLKQYNFTIAEENTAQDATVRISLLQSGITQ
tara:strand:- start:151 stop:747 length:597 start_codon:yes stop_codon:yes gene_type:complete